MVRARVRVHACMHACMHGQSTCVWSFLPQACCALSSCSVCTMASRVEILEAQMQEARAQARLVNERLRAHRLSARSCQRREDAKRLHLRQVGLRIVALVEHDEEKVLDKWLSVKLPLLQGDERCNLLSNILDEFTALEIDDIVRMQEPIAHGDKILVGKSQGRDRRMRTPLVGMPTECREGAGTYSGCSNSTEGWQR